MEYMLSLDTKSVVPLKLLAALKRIRNERLYAADTVVGPEDNVVKRPGAGASHCKEIMVVGIY